MHIWCSSPCTSHVEVVARISCVCLEHLSVHSCFPPFSHQTAQEAVGCEIPSGLDRDTTLPLTCSFKSAHNSWKSLGEVAELVPTQATNRAEFLQECSDGRLDGVVAAFRTFPSVDLTGLFNQELVKVLPKSLRYLSHC